ncbi:ribonuclease P protein component [Petroclostridium sp. X23]|uniref:ribonuclease P protein component n=1 Tax=Petroclostridium sp. X23 TaxID=3045146 RepID=UPI0024ACAFD1|nr:ribonuclease P protein component [Petroclostridium sp. X23]WHH57250.1 ribonuclease P protein component [Petroclostridium sp. X23]
MQTTISLNENRTFKRIYAKGNSIANNLLVIYFIANGLNINRLGITVNKKIGKAVARNRVRRLIKESYRLKESTIKEGYDIIFVARVRSREASYREVSGAMHNLLKRVDLIK